MRIRKSVGERIWELFLKALMVFAAIITIYPFIYVLNMSISKPEYVIQGSIGFLPKGFSLNSYKMVFENKAIWQSYYNTIWYTVIGTFINIILTVVTAYPLSRKSFFIKKQLMLFITFTMFFSGGLIPSFILINSIGLYNTRWAMVIPGAIATMNLIIARTYFQGIPDSLEESAKLDGANEIKILFRIMIPLAKPIISVLVLYYGVAHWNSYFNALIYLPSQELHPMQVYLMKILIQESEELAGDTQMGIGRSMQVEQLKYAAIIVTILPILFVYPFLQKYFVKGVMIGAIKG